MIQLTESAAKRITAQLAKRGHGVGLRVAVKKSGCSGWAYVLDFADEVGADDSVFATGDAKLVIKQEHLDKLDGLTLDYQREGLNESYKFLNPNVKAQCGCGESFAV